MLILLIISLVFTSTLSISYWVTISTKRNVEVNIDVHNAGLSVELGGSPENKVLVPRGYAFFTDEVDEYVFTFDVDITERELQPGVTLNLMVTADNIKIDGSDTYANLVVIEVTENGDLQIGNDLLTISVTVSLLEPDTEEVYNAIAGKKITFDLNFVVNPN